MLFDKDGSEVPTEVPLRPEGPLEVSEVTDSGIQLRWYPPKDNGGGPITGYIVDARECDNTDVIRWWLIVKFHRRILILTMAKYSIASLSWWSRIALRQRWKA